MGRVLLSGVLMDLREYMSNSAKKKQSRGKILLCLLNRSDQKICIGFEQLIALAAGKNLLCKDLSKLHAFLIE